MSDSATITREQLRTVYVATELGGKDVDANHFSYAGLAKSTYSFGQLQFDVGNNDSARDFLKANGFDAADINDLRSHGGLSAKKLVALDNKLQAIPQEKIDKFTNDYLDKRVADVGSVIDQVRVLKLAAADAIIGDQKLQLGIADYANQFGHVGPQFVGFLAGKSETLNASGKIIQAGNPPTREDIQTFINATSYGQNPKNSSGINGRADHFNEAMAELKLGPSVKASTHTSEKGGSILKLGSHGEAVSALQADLASLGYTDSKGRRLKSDNDFGQDTETAVRAFQRDHGLEQNGVGPKTLHAIQTAVAPLKEHNSGPLPAVSSMSSLPSVPGFDDPRNALSPNHGLYEKLQQRIPDASEERLLQFTAACHANKITGDNLSTINLDEGNMKIGFHGSSFLSTPATVDLNTPPPQPLQSIQQIQQHDQQQAQDTQMNQQAGQASTPGMPGR